MLLTREPQTPFGQLHPAEGCAEFPLLLRDEHWAELQQKATTGQRTIGQMIRQALGHYLAEVRDRRDANDRLDDSQPDRTDGHGVLTVMLQIPLSRLAELEALAAQRDTTASALIRHVVCFSFLSRSSGPQVPSKT